MHRRIETSEDQMSIDLSTAYYKLFNVSEECLMYEFGMKHFPGYQPEHGHGYFKLRDKSESTNTSHHNKVILMSTEVYNNDDDDIMSIMVQYY